MPRNHVLIDLQAVRVQGWAGVVTQLRPVTYEAAEDVSADQADRTITAAAGGGEPSAEIHSLADLQAGGMKGRAVAIAHARLGAVEAAADVGTEQADRTELAGAAAVIPRRRNMARLTCRASPPRAGPESLRRLARRIEAAADVGAGPLPRRPPPGTCRPPLPGVLTSHTADTTRTVISRSADSALFNDAVLR